MCSNYNDRNEELETCLLNIAVNFHPLECFERCVEMLPLRLGHIQDLKISEGENCQNNLVSASCTAFWNIYFEFLKDYLFVGESFGLNRVPNADEYWYSICSPQRGLANHLILYAGAFHRFHSAHNFVTSRYSKTEIGQIAALINQNPLVLRTANRAPEYGVTLPFKRNSFAFFYTLILPSQLA